ncbi:DUF2271 domain-containing protein [Stenotrophomonas sp. B1-1]|uniref:DUF2271 domain-containing protein n=1 Tax=Stenotrophomonas sp. B1-1 TaxID=2710648 RepID=UPI0013D90C0F|nr:DUF2271 domain-containing protein [Stenotrophomonas sp. B1-1]
MFRRTFRLLLALAASWLAVPAAVAAPQIFHRDDVLGTSLDISVDASEAPAQAALQAVLAETARLDGVLSRWRDDSELTRFNTHSGPQTVSPDLRAVLQLCEHWRQRSEGIFSCRLGRAAERWRQAASSGVLPPRDELRALASAAAQAEFEPARSGALTRPEAVVFDVDGVAKGYILDRALDVARKAAPAARAIKIDIGGDARYWQAAGQTAPWQVGVADARRPRDNGTPLATLALRDGAIAGSGHATRGYTVGRRHYSHILDPFSGWPMQFAPAATVVAPDAASADVLATALSVMPIRDGLALADALPDVAAFVLSDTGVSFVSQRWPALLADAPPRAENLERLVVDYQIPQLAAERYFAPYLALWVTTADGTLVRQLLVLGTRSRYLQSLPQWWRRYGGDDLPAIQGIARPTRLPGEYSLAWDGRDDRGQTVADGEYLLQVEAARQAGGHEFLSLPFTLKQGRAVDSQHRGQSEIGTLCLHLTGR